MIDFKTAMASSDAILDDYLATVSIKNFRVEVDEFIEYRKNETEKIERMARTMVNDMLTGNPTPLVAVTEERISRN